MQFFTEREALEKGKEIRDTKEKDIVVYEKRKAFFLCGVDRFFSDQKKDCEIVCYLAHPNSSKTIRMEKSPFISTERISLTFNYKRR